MIRRRVVLVALAMMVLAGAGAAGEAATRGPHRPNLPPGWTWPPSRDTRRDGRRCLRDLRELGVRYRRAPRKRMIATPVVIPSMVFGSVALVPTYRKPPFIMDCRLARALATYATMLSAIGIRELHFSSIYDYRRVRLYHKVQRALSRHSLGLAIDVFKVVLASGAVVVVKQDYWNSPALMVAELALRASGGFRAVLSPSVDPISHDDHLHLEAKVEEAPPRKKEAARKKRRARHRARTAAPAAASSTSPDAAEPPDTAVEPPDTAADHEE